VCSSDLIATGMIVMRIVICSDWKSVKARMAG